MIPVGKAESPGGARELLDDHEKIGVVDDLIITLDKSCPTRSSALEGSSAWRSTTWRFR
jgi:hypothetical protein